MGRSGVGAASRRTSVYAATKKLSELSFRRLLLSACSARQCRRWRLFIHFFRLRASGASSKVVPVFRLDSVVKLRWVSRLAMAWPLKARRGFVHCQCDFWPWLSGVQRSNGRWGAAPPPACFRPMASADHGSRHVLCNNNMQKPCTRTACAGWQSWFRKRIPALTGLRGLCLPRVFQAVRSNPGR